MQKLYKEALGGIGFGLIYTTREVTEAKQVLVDVTVDMIVMDIVDADDGMPALEQLLHHVAADESG